jgi:cell wall-associated NlpC family hydrolase
MRLNRRVLTAALAVAVCATSSQLPGTSAHAAPTGSSANSATSTTVAATIYTVANGDSLWTISLKLKVPFPALLAANKLTATSVILAGQQLVVPAGSTPSTTVPAKPATTKPASTKGAPVAPAATTPPTTARPAVPANTTAPTNYTIVNGDYLYGIAFNYGVSFNALLAANKFTITSAIHPGMVIIIPAGALTTPKSTAAKLTTAPAANATTGIGATATATSTVTTVPPASAAPHVTIAPTGNSKLDAVLAFALAQIGKPYVFAGAGPDTYDCSGLVLAAYAQAGIQLIHQSAVQATEGTAVDWTTAPILPGDLVFTAGSATPGMISHVGMAINSTQWIQAPKPGSTVGIGALPAAEKILAVRRFIAV